MALARTSMAQVGGTENKAPTTFKVVHPKCQLRPMPNSDYFTIGLLRVGTTFRGFPFVNAGESWVRLHDQDAAVYVPDRGKREDGVWAIQVHPQFGRILKSQEEELQYGEDGAGGDSPSGGDGVKDGGKGFGVKLELRIAESFEEMLRAEWTITDDNGQKNAWRGPHTSCVVEMVIDTASGRPSGEAKNDPKLDRTGLQPAKGATVKRVDCSKDTFATISNMPDGRYFLLSVVVSFGTKRRLRSPWVCAATLNSAGRTLHLGSCDALGVPRGKCMGEDCACKEFVPVGSWGLNSSSKSANKCRRCGCPSDFHMRMGQVGDPDASSASNAKTRNKSEDEKKETRVELPPDSRHWTDREKKLWSWSNGALHPRNNPFAARKRNPGGGQAPDGDEASSPGRRRGAPGTPSTPSSSSQQPTLRGKMASIVVPTMEDRQVWHELVWKNFCNQTWPNKELIIIETYKIRRSPFFAQVQDDRLVYLSFRCGHSTELSIGSKRNIAQHIALGDYIVNFDDDDLYAYNYVETMIRAMERLSFSFITLSSWYFMDINSGQFGYFDAKEWARIKKMSDKAIDGWLWGYGFSYVHKLEPALDMKIDYPNQNMEEDINYIRAWKREVGDDKVGLFYDEQGIVLHGLHGGNTSNAFALKEVRVEEVMDADFAEDFDFVKFLLTRFPRRHEPSRFIEEQCNPDDPVQRKYREIVVHHNGTVFKVRCMKGAFGYELKDSVAKHFGARLSTYENLQLHRQDPALAPAQVARTDDSTPAQEVAATEGDSEPGGGKDAAPPATAEPPPQEADPFLAAIYGSWFYGKKNQEYVIRKASDGQLRWYGPHLGNTVSGHLTPVGPHQQWLQADLYLPDGETCVGTLRLRYIVDADTIVSNFRGLEKKVWGKDILARREGAEALGNDEMQRLAEVPPPEEGENAEPPAEFKSVVQRAPEKDPYAQIEDDERVGLQTREVWAVLRFNELPVDQAMPVAPNGSSAQFHKDASTVFRQIYAGLDEEEAGETRKADQKKPEVDGSSTAQPAMVETAEKPAVSELDAAQEKVDGSSTAQPAVVETPATPAITELDAKPGDGNIELVIMIDGNLELKETISVVKGATIGLVKEKLCAGSLTEDLTPADFGLRWLGSAGPRLADSTVLNDDKRCLELCE